MWKICEICKRLGWNHFHFNGKRERGYYYDELKLPEGQEGERI